MDEVSDHDIRDAQRLLRTLTGAEPYAPHVYSTAREIARIVRERLQDWKERTNALHDRVRELQARTERAESIAARVESNGEIDQ